MRGKSLRCFFPYTCLVQGRLYWTINRTRREFGRAAAEECLPGGRPPCADLPRRPETSREAFLLGNKPHTILDATRLG